MTAITKSNETVGLYVCGPVTAYDDRNLPAFEDAKKQLEAAGFVVVIPHEIIPPDCSWLDAMALAMTILKNVNGVATLDGWESSIGAYIEVLAAKGVDSPVYAVDEWIEIAADPEVMEAELRPWRYRWNTRPNVYRAAAGADETAAAPVLKSDDAEWLSRELFGLCQSSANDIEQKINRALHRRPDRNAHGSLLMPGA